MSANSSWTYTWMQSLHSKLLPLEMEVMICFALDLGMGKSKCGTFDPRVVCARWMVSGDSACVPSAKFTVQAVGILLSLFIRILAIITWWRSINMGPL